METAEFCGYALSWWDQLVTSRRRFGKEPVETWLKLRAMMRRQYIPRQYHEELLKKQSQTKLYPSNSDQKQQGSKTTSWFSEEDIKELSQVIIDVEKQLRKTNTTHPCLEAHKQERLTAVSDLKVEEPESAAQIQEDQTKIPTITSQKDDQQ